MSAQSLMFGELVMRHQQRKPVITGHAAPPGTGPNGETCRTCLHLEGPAGYTKACGLMRGYWEQRTQKQNDVRLKDAACAKWESASPASAREMGEGV
jgi:hypothetical protein